MVYHISKAIHASIAAYCFCSSESCGAPHSDKRTSLDKFKPRDAAAMVARDTFPFKTTFFSFAYAPSSTTPTSFFLCLVGCVKSGKSLESFAKSPPTFLPILTICEDVRMVLRELG